MRRRFMICLICALRACGPAPGQEPESDAMSVYKQEVIQGFTVLIHPEVMNHDTEAAQMRGELTSQLEAIVRVVPNEPLSALRQVRIWVEWEKKKGGAAEFH